MSIEIEARFLEIDKEGLISKLRSLNAQDLQEEMLDEIIYYDKFLEWKKNKKFIRLRKSNSKIILTYKHHSKTGSIETKEVETEVKDYIATQEILESIGLVKARHQQKIRHSFILDKVKVDIDTWPQIPTYVELEGESEKEIKQVADKLGFNWNQVVLDDARTIIENRYKIPVSDMTWFTFNRFK